MFTYTHQLICVAITVVCTVINGALALRSRRGLPEHFKLSGLYNAFEAQKSDDGLFFVPVIATEAYLQGALKQLHDAFEKYVKAL